MDFFRVLISQGNAQGALIELRRTFENDARCAAARPAFRRVAGMLN
jgi:hypothetical protein